MTELHSILTDRHYQSWPSWQIVYEWEDELSFLLHIPLRNTPSLPSNLVYSTFKRFDNRFFKGYMEYITRPRKKSESGLSLYFEMHMKPYRCFSNEASIIPVLIDFWLPDNIKVLKKMYAHCPYLLVTNLEVLHFLKEHQFRNKLVHFPMTLPSRYQLNGDEVFDKKYDIVVAGRKNSILWDYLLRYEKQHPDIEYLHQVEQNGELFYRSNQTGIVGKFQSREEYIELIRSAKVAFYATPGMDEGAARTTGFNPVTPRFFELLGAGCHVLARYPDTVETRFYTMKEISPAIMSYEQFEEALTDSLRSEVPVAKNAVYLKSHYTYTLVDILNQIINKG